MKCEKAFDRYLSLDKNQAVPLRVSLHLLCCPVCRTAVRTLTRAERALARPLAPLQARTFAPLLTSPLASANAQAASGVNSAEIIDRSVRLAFERIQAAGFAYPPVEAVARRVSMSRWLLVGVLMAAGFVVIPFSMIGEWTRSVYGLAFSLPFYLVSGLAVTVYSGLFIGSNIDFFVKKFGFR